MKLFRILSALALLGSCVASNWGKYEGYSVLSVRPENSEHVKFLAKLQDTTHLDFWDEPSKPGVPMKVLVSPEDSADFTSLLDRNGIRYVVTDIDVAREIKEEWQRLEKRDVGAMAFNYSDFNDYETTMSELALMAADCPSGFTCTIETIGTSVQGNAIQMMKIISNQGGRKAIWIDSLIHAREWLAGATTMNIFRRMIDEAGQGGEADTLLTYDWYYVPIDNPDGYNRTWVDDRLWRKNMAEIDNSTCLGIDLNRNFDFNWGEPGASELPCSFTYMGPSAASEPETQALQNQILSVASDITAVWTVHTYGQYLIHPFGNCSNPPPPIFAEVSRVTNETCASIMATYNTVWECGNTCEILYRTSGTTHDWAYGAAGIEYSWTPELRGNFGGFVTPPSEIPFSVQEIWNGLLTLVAEAIP